MSDFKDMEGRDAVHEPDHRNHLQNGGNVQYVTKEELHHYVGEPLPLPNVTMVIVDTRDHDAAIFAIMRSLKQIKPHSVLFFTDKEFPSTDFQAIKIDPLTSLDDYSRFMCLELWKYISTSHILVIQHDGFVLDASAWTDEFLQYDYIGAPWNYKDGRNVGNGGFSLRSNVLMTMVAHDQFIQSVGIYGPEDEVICRLYGKYLKKQGINFAPEELAHRFSYEMHMPTQKTFGFHNFGHAPYRPPVVIKRTGAMGDVLMLEPVLERFYSDGYRVILDCIYDYMGIFDRHPYPIEHVLDCQQRGEDCSGYLKFDLDMSYEQKPQQLVLKSYYEACGIKNGLLRNSQLVEQHPNYRLFDRYIVLHVDDTGIPHRDVRGVDWQAVADYIEQSTLYKVFRVGKRETKGGGLYINTSTKSLLQYFIGGADYFIGIDSAPSQIAVASGVKSMIFFGSVNPAYRYADLSNIFVMQNGCPVKNDGCYHSVVSVTGTDCDVDIKRPPCITHTTEAVIEAINKFLL